MCPKKDQKVEVINETIYINRPAFLKSARATFDKPLLELISSVTWTPTSFGYLKSQLGLLHQVVMKHFYGADVLKEAYKLKYVIEHIDNDGYNCTYENLALVPRLLNTAKGLTYDIDRIKTEDRFSINFTKDRSTHEYQISIAFNEISNITISDKTIPIHVIYLRYGLDYTTTLLDAQSILNDLVSQNKFVIKNTRATRIICRPVEFVVPTQDELETGIVYRDGEILFLQNHPKIRLLSPAHNKELHEE